jgi:hypothetical protein
MLVGGAAAWSLAARAQPGSAIRHVGVLLPAAADDLQFQTWVGAFLQGLGKAGWTIGRNVRIDTRWWKIRNASPVAPCSIRLVRQNRKRPLKMGLSRWSVDRRRCRHCTAVSAVKLMHRRQ